jgi:hypothetical protein
MADRILRNGRSCQSTVLRGRVKTTLQLHQETAACCCFLIFDESPLMKALLAASLCRLSPLAPLEDSARVDLSLAWNIRKHATEQQHLSHLRQIPLDRP